MKPVAKTVLWGQICLYAGLGMCLVIRPEGLETNSGISYFGVYLNTVVFYAIGLLGSAFFSWYAAQRLTPDLWPVRWGLIVFSALMVGIVVTPYTAARWVDFLHIAFGSALFSLQLILSGWLVWRLRFVWWTVVLSVAELAAGLLSAKYVSPAHGYLIQTQILFQLFFGGLLILSLQQLNRD